MNPKKYRYAVMVVFFFFAVVSAAGEKVWVSAKGAKLKADKKASAETIKKLPMGTGLKVLDFQKRWYKVSTNELETGWIYRGKVAKTPPATDDDMEEDLLGDLDESGIMLAAADTSRSIRGKKKKGDDDNNTSKAILESDEYLEALNRVLSFYTSDDEIDVFLKQGKIGEYAK